MSYILDYLLIAMAILAVYAIAGIVRSVIAFWKQEFPNE